jgi:predicted secreted protein
MTQVASIGHGVRFLRQKTDLSYEDVGQVHELGGPTLARDAVDASHTLSPNRWREFIGGMRDGGEFSATIALEPGAGATKDHRKLFDDFKNDDAVTYRILWANVDATSFTVTALITGLEHAEPIDDKMTLNATFKVSGEPTLADGAA